MYKPIERIDELKNIFIRFRLVETALDAVVIFTALYIVLSFAGVNFVWALFVVPVLFFITALKYGGDVNIIRLVEKRYPAFRERLGALYDSRDEKNIVVADLAASVDSDLENVKYSSFISITHLGIRITVILILVTFILSSALIHSPKNPLPDNTYSSLYKKYGFIPDEFPKNPLPDNGGSGPDIFGEPSVVKIGNDSQGVLIYRSQGSEPNIRGEGRQVSGYSTPFPVDVSSSQIYSEELPAEYQLIVKNYFTNLSVMD